MLACFGKTARELASYISLLKEASGLMARLYITNLYPSIELFQQITGLKGRVERLHKSSDAILENIINDHKVANIESKHRQDLVDVLLKFNEPGHEQHLSIDNIKAVIQVSLSLHFFGGSMSYESIKYLSNLIAFYRG